MITKLNCSVLSGDEDVIFAIFRPVYDLESWMGGLCFPFWFFGFVVCNSPLFGANQNPSINPAHTINQPNNLGIVKCHINTLEPLHADIFHGDNKFLAIPKLTSFNLCHIIAQMINILFLPAMRKTTDITATDHVNIIAWHVQFLSVLKFLDENFVVVVKVETGQVVTSQKEKFVGW